MNLVLLVAKVWGVFGGAWKLFRHAGTILGFINTVKDVFEQTIKSDQKIPSKVQAIILIKAVEHLFDKGVIDFPGVDEKEIVESLKSIRENMGDAVTVSRGNLRAWKKVVPPSEAEAEEKKNA